MYTLTFLVLTFMLPNSIYLENATLQPGFQVEIMVEGKAAPKDEAFVILLGKNGTLYDLEGHKIDNEGLRLILFVALGSPKGQCRVFLDVERGSNTIVLIDAIEKIRKRADPKAKTIVIVRF